MNNPKAMVVASRRKNAIDDAILYSELSKIQPAPKKDAAASGSSDTVDVAKELKAFEAMLEEIGSRLDEDQRLAIVRQAMANAIALIVSSSLKDSKDSYFNALSEYMNSKMLHKVREHEVAAVLQAKMGLTPLFR